jgi:hypothetical protein
MAKREKAGGVWQCVVVRPGRLPDPVRYESRPADLLFGFVRPTVGGTVDLNPYPRQYGRPGLWVLVHDTGLLIGLPYNRWGLVGTFVVVGDQDLRGLTDDEVEGVLRDLRDVDGGYLDEACGIGNALREPFQKYGIPPAGWAPPAGAWFK